MTTTDKNRVYQPRVFLIAETRLNDDEVRRWLEHVDAGEEYVASVLGCPLADGEPISDAEKLASMAGKRCYMSFREGLNPNVSRVRKDIHDHLTNILKEKHGAVLEHASFTFAIEEVSRVFTGEMNRHRAGWAISEGSMRFIRFGERVPYWVPTSFQGPDVLDAEVAADLLQAARDYDPACGALSTMTLDERKHVSRVVMASVFEYVRRAYRMLEAIWQMDESHHDFKYKKIVTSAMRRIIPMGVATGGVWTGNIRALRHVMGLRCAPAAEEEIALVFSTIAKLMSERYPAVFGDFKQDEQGYWRPEHVKV